MPAVSLRTATLLLLAATLGACGYRMVRPDVGAGRSIAVPTAINDSSWLGLEVPLTRGVRADLQRLLDIRLGPGADSDFVLETDISDVGRRSRLTLRSGGAAVGISTLDVHWQLLDRTGKVVGKGDIRRSLEFLTSLDEDAYSAFDELIAEIAQQIALEVGAQLDAAAEPREQA
jgi:hypothetical protein